MSRRKQTKPKPFKHPSEEDVIQEQASDAENSLDTADAEISGSTGTLDEPTSAESPSPVHSSSQPPLTSAEDALDYGCTNAVKIEAATEADECALEASNSMSEGSVSPQSPMSRADNKSPRGTTASSQQSFVAASSLQNLRGMVCSCGISFSSLSTLSAHQKYYCTSRTGPGSCSDTGAEADESESVDARAGSPLPSGMSGGTQLVRGEPASERTTFTCAQCPFVTGKSSTLSRHMSRQHAPEAQSLASTSCDGVDDKTRSEDRFCRNCDIQFSSLNTYRVHKQLYCGTRIGRSASVTGTIVTTPPFHLSPSSMATAASATAGQESGVRMVALPTDPVLLLPLPVLQGATLLTTAPQAASVPSVFLQDGTVRSLVDLVKCAETARSDAAVGDGSARDTSLVANAPLQMPLSRYLAGTPEHGGGPSCDDFSEHAAVSVNCDTPLDLTRKRSLDAVCLNNEEKRRRVSLRRRSETKVDGDRSSAESAGNSRLSGSSENGDAIARDAVDSAGSSESGTPRISVKPLNTILESDKPLKSFPVAAVPGHLPDHMLHPATSLLDTFSEHSRALTLSAMSALRNGTSLEAAGIWAPRLLLPSSALSQSTTPSEVAAIKNAQYRCQDCGVSFHKRESFDVHRRSYCAGRERHAARPSPNEDNSVSSKDATTTKADNSSQSVAESSARNHLACKACSTKFLSADTLRAHQLFYCTATNADAATRNQVPQTSCCLEDDPVDHVSNSLASTTLSASARGYWKCPCCAVISSSAVSAQKHLETHNNVRAFKCSLCGYKGNTLRGMRTHIRMHFTDRKAGDMSEESFIACIVANSDDDETVVGSRATKTEKCPLCPYRSSNVETMLKHFALAHPTAREECTVKIPLASSQACAVSLSGATSLLAAAAAAQLASDKRSGAVFYGDAPTILDQHQLLRVGRPLVGSGVDKQCRTSPVASTTTTTATRSSPTSHAAEVKIKQEPEEPDAGELAAKKSGDRSVASTSCTAASSERLTDEPSVASCSARLSSEESVSPAGNVGNLVCRHCNITFRQRDSYKAHAQFYCPGRLSMGTRSLTPVQ